MSDHPTIPQIVTVDYSSTHTIEETDPNDNFSSPQTIQVNSGRNRPHNVPGLLSPQSAGFSLRASLDVPTSPTPTYVSSNDGSSITVPPSPTLSNSSSVHFQTSVALRDNRPGSGLSSLGLLNPPDAGPSHTHRRKGSTATYASSSEGTEPDHRENIPLTPIELHHVKSNTTSLTHVESTHSREKREITDSDTATAVHEKNKKKDEEDKDADALDNQRVALPQDADTDPTPFSFKPYELAHMLDPKNLKALENFGGIKAVLKGLGTSRTRGLETGLARSDSRKAGDGRPGAGGGASQRHDPEEQSGVVPGIVVTAPEGGKEGFEAEAEEDDSNDGPAFSATLDDRRRIYGDNTLPKRATKSLLSLMWTALKDKVLVRIFFLSTISQIHAGV